MEVVQLLLPGDNLHGVPMGYLEGYLFQGEGLKNKKAFVKVHKRTKKYFESTPLIFTPFPIKRYVKNFLHTCEHS